MSYAKEIKLKIVTQQFKKIPHKQENGFKYEKQRILGKGTYGEVWEIKTKDNKLMALKTIKEEKFADVNKIYQEVQLGLLFSRQDTIVPVIQYYDVFLEYIDGSILPYTLHILMEKGQCDLIKVTREANGPLDFKRFFPIFRDCILGLSYIHSKNIAHRDIKLGNILKINEYSYKLADYGEG